VTALGILRRNLYIWTLFVSMAVCLCGAPQDAPGIYAVRLIPPQQQVAIKPAQFKRRLDEQKTHNNLVPLWKSLHVTSSHFESCETPVLCEVDIRMPHFAESRLAVARYSGSTDRFSRFLVFVSSPYDNENWQLAAHIDLAQQFMAPTYKLIEASRHSWLVIEPWLDEGTAISAFSTNWYEIDGDALREVFSYPSLGLQGVPWMMRATERLVTSKLLSFESDDSSERVTLEFKEEFSDENRAPLFQLAKQVIYSRPAGSISRFQLNVEASKLSVDEFTNLFDTRRGNLGRDFFSTFYSELKEIAQSSNARKRRWLCTVATPGPYERAPADRAQLLQILRARGECPNPY
jgi:hypothetical protein